MEPKKITDSEFFSSKLKEIVQDFDKFAVIAALETYESLNLKELSLLLQKPRTTLLGHIKILLEDHLIEIDSRTTAEKWGKFYKLTEVFNKEFTKHRPMLYETYTKHKEEIIEDISQEQIKESILKRKEFRKETGLTADKLIQYCSFAYFIQKFVFDKIEEMDEIDEKFCDFSESDFMKIYFILFSRGFLVSKPIHVMKYGKLIGQFLTSILELSKEISEEIDEDNIEEEKIHRYYLHVFGGSLKT